MTILQSIADLAKVPGPVFVAVGVFDGVHLGHESLIRQTMARAGEQGGSAVALTFDPHPARVLRPAFAPHLLTSSAHKERLIGALGCGFLLVQKFDAVFASQPPESFIEALVAAANPLRMICVGHNWAFGRGRSGNVALLTGLGSRLGFETLEIAPVAVDGELVSSTRIRAAIEMGDFETARKFLGRDYTILGTVRHGAGLGAKIGFPTLNLAAHNEQFPPNGVYAVDILRRDQWLKGVANIGLRPTVSEAAERTLEVHVFDFSEDCYGEDVEVRFTRFLRAEQKFPDVEHLKAQIARDVRAAKDDFA